MKRETTKLQTICFLLPNNLRNHHFIHALLAMLNVRFENFDILKLFGVRVRVSECISAKGWSAECKLLCPKMVVHSES